MVLPSQGEGELVEFKRAEKSYSTDDIGKYFSGLANEANLRNAQCAWLIFGVDNKSHKIVGSEYRVNVARLQSLKKQISDDTNPSITFLNIHEVLHDNGRVVMFEIPAAPRGIPIAWKGHYYARDDESLVGLSMNKIESIRQQTVADWSAEIVKVPTIPGIFIYSR